jgi:peptidyl-prolyl cis-trans isomerase SurA
MKILTSSFFMLFLSLGLIAQSGGEELFRVGEQVVTVEEFQYIYEKTNPGKADYSKSSLREYLTLFENFKLKVQAARDLDIDKNEAYLVELGGYKKQLTNSYLFDKQIKERLALQAYERKHWDLSFSHILFKVQPTASAADTLAAWNKAQDAYRKLQAGEDFGRLAYQVTEDQNSKLTGGQMGFYTALFPDGYYELENAVYNTPIGQFSKVVRTQLGYHIVKVHEKRPARGEMEIAHISFRRSGDGLLDAQTREQAQLVYEKLIQSMDFAQAAALYSEDTKTKDNGGYLGVIGINQFDQNFEDAIFALTEDGQISQPLESRMGLHIVKRIGKKALPNRQDFINAISNRLTNTDRERIAREHLLNKIKDANNYVFNREVYEGLVKLLAEADLSAFNWKAPELEMPRTLFTIENEWQKMRVTDAEFLDYLEKNNRSRMTRFRNVALESVLDAFYKEFEFDRIGSFEEKNLERTHLEFRLLMKEYEEGLLFFEVSKKEIWDRASEDTLGLMSFFQSNRTAYQTAETVQLATIQISNGGPSFAKKVYKYVKQKGLEGLEEKFQSADKRIEIVMEEFSKDNTMILPGNLPWQLGNVSALESSENTSYFHTIVDYKPQRLKELDETRGFVIADYQSYLETKWIETLREKYPVELKEDIFLKMVKE